MSLTLDQLNETVKDLIRSEEEKQPYYIIGVDDEWYEGKKFKPLLLAGFRPNSVVCSEAMYHRMKSTFNAVTNRGEGFPPMLEYGMDIYTASADLLRGLVSAFKVKEGEAVETSDGQ